MPIQEYQALAGELVANENLMLQTLGFDIGIDHPHTHVVKCCQLVKASKVGSRYIHIHTCIHTHEQLLNFNFVQFHLTDFMSDDDDDDDDRNWLKRRIS